ncbi:MAG: NAD(P)H-hydrate dehydratase [Longimonas sp.]|uniref:NAD(P)H-hydrate dehydratase n=1 Tax=Longimonas sp. TaxID=2039626 RepID=UPI0039766EED
MAKVRILKKVLSGKITCDVHVFLVKRPSSRLAQKNLRRVKQLGIPVHYYLEDAFREILEQSDVAVDGMLGIGISGALRPPYDDIAAMLNESDAGVISVDVPTGMGQEVAVQPDLTVTFHAAKDGMTPDNSGDILVHDIGIPDEATRQIGPGDMAWYPPHGRRSHKGDNGTVLVVGGGPYTGAPALAAMAALRTGADLAMAAVPGHAWQVVASFSPDIIARRLDGDVLHPRHLKDIEPLLERADSLVVGPGLGNASQTMQAVDALLDTCIERNMPAVVDADAIAAMADKTASGSMIVTPHAGEFKRLMGTMPSDDLEKRIASVRAAARARNCTILLKGWTDVVSDGDTVKSNHVGNEGMTVGGTGDVLSGVAGALLAMRVPAYNAARMAAFLNGSAGNAAFERKGYGMTATDLLARLPDVIAEYGP